MIFFQGILSEFHAEEIMAEEVSVGGLVFTREEDDEGHSVVSVHKVMDLEGWVSFTPCPPEGVEWSMLKNNCFPFNGRAEVPPRGRWVVFEYIGRDGSSLNLSPDKSELGFSDEEISALVVVINLMYAEPSRLRTQEIPDIIVKH